MGQMAVGPAVLLLFVLGCAKPYVPPTVDEPHGIVKLRRTYHLSAGTTLTERASVNEFEVTNRSRSSALDETRSEAVRVRPGAATWVVGSNFSHPERRSVSEPYTVQTPYTTSESYSCGSGSDYRTCTRSVTRYHSETRYRTVTRTVDVSDGACVAQSQQVVEAGRSYLLQYAYSAPEICSLLCVEQLPRDDGRFDSRPCDVPVDDDP